MRCEVCGRKIRESPMRVVIEGAKLTVCGSCAKHGQATWEPAAPKPAPVPQMQPSLGSPFKGPIPIKKRVVKAKVDTTKEVISDYAEVIKHAREKAGLSVEDLGMRISEKASVLRKIELGKIAPTNQLIARLEHELKVSLLVSVAEEKDVAQSVSKASNRELTLGDLIEFKKKDKGE
ncbi:MAG: multiprotein bridging factor aMBF1 [Candidatus Bathyarchaeota archaeon]|nr:multiprotein bridging factor aMBF1 [Candidatus Bathyarchaeota archaeon]